MGNFRSNDRDSRFGGRGRSGGRSGGFNRRREGGFRDRDSDGYGERRRPQMHDVVCDKCGKNCQVPFKPSGDKPVLCSDCFRSGGSSSSNSRDRSSQGQGQSSGSGISQEQFKELNRKVDKILGILENIEFEEDFDEDEAQEDEEESEEAEGTSEEKGSA